MEAKEEKFYVGTFGKPKTTYVIKAEIGLICSYINVDNSSFGRRGCFTKGNGFTIEREATFEEAEQLKMCIKANKYIPYSKQEIITNYSIY